MGSRGSDHPNAKLTESQVQEIFLSPLPAKALAQEYPVSVPQVYNIWARKTWVHATNDLKRPEKS